MADKRLQVFYAVSKELSFTRASEILHMTQPAITFQIKQLEEFFDTRLFDRQHNKITLTEAGKVVYIYAERILGQYERMINSIKEITEDMSGTIFIGASSTIGEYILPKLLGDFKKKFPDISVSVRVGNVEYIISMIENNTIDFAMVEGPVHNKSLDVAPCMSDEMQLICHCDHPLANRKEVTIENIRKYPYILREDGSGTRTIFEEYIKKQNLSCEDFNVTLEMGSPEAVKMAVEEGIGVSIASTVTIQKELKLRTIKSIPINPPIYRKFHYVYNKQKFRHNAVNELLNFFSLKCSAKHASHF